MQQFSAAMRRDIRSLDKARNRRELGLFVAEGTKCVLETIGHFECVMLMATQQWLSAHEVNAGGADVFALSPSEMGRLSRQPSAPDVIAVYRLPQSTPLPEADKLLLALDCVQDPGNLGTIMRACDWMGVTDIIASGDTVDVFNPKVVQATMGSIGRVHMHYVENLADTLAAYAARGVKVYGTFLDGQPIYSSRLTNTGIIVMGNEGRGISSEVSRVVNCRLFIPPYPADRSTVESLNVAMATAITLAEFRRRATTDVV